MSDIMIKGIDKKQNRKSVFGKSVAVLTAAGVLASFCCGCSSIKDKFGLGTEYVFQVSGEKCEPGEAKVILLNYQKEYGNAYGVDLWSHDYGKDMSLEQYVKDLTLSQLAEVYTLDAIAEEQEVELSEEEQTKVSQAAEEYYNGLSEEENAYLGIGKEEVQKLYERYVLAQKLYYQLTESVEQEVSDDEARVMQAKQIFTADESKAQGALQQLQGGTEFASVAASFNEADAVDLTVNRSSFAEDVIEQVFALKDGTYSSVISTEKGYYIFYCVKSYDPDLTQAHKADVLEKRMEEAVNGTYNSYASEADSSLNQTVWEEITVDTSLKTEGSSFLEIYEKYFPGEEKK